MGYNSPKEAKKMVGGIMKKRTLIVLGLILVALLFYPTIRNMATAYEAIVVEKIDGSVDFSTRKGSLKHADYKAIMLCDTKGKEFEKYVENAVFDRIKEGDYIHKKLLNNGFDIASSVQGAEQLKMYCKVRPPKPKPEPEKKAAAPATPTPPPPGPPPADKPVVPAVQPEAGK